MARPSQIRSRTSCSRRVRPSGCDRVADRGPTGTAFTPSRRIRARHSRAGGRRREAVEGREGGAQRVLLVGVGQRHGGLVGAAEPGPLLGGVAVPAGDLGGVRLRRAVRAGRPDSPSRCIHTATAPRNVASHRSARSAATATSSAASAVRPASHRASARARRHRMIQDGLQRAVGQLDGLVEHRLRRGVVASGEHGRHADQRAEPVDDGRGRAPERLTTEGQRLVQPSLLLEDEGVAAAEAGAEGRQVVLVAVRDALEVDPLGLGPVPLARRRWRAGCRRPGRPAPPDRRRARPRAPAAAPACRRPGRRRPAPIPRCSSASLRTSARPSSSASPCARRARVSAIAFSPWSMCWLARLA